MWIEHLGTWLGEPSNAGLMVGIDDLRDLFQPERFYDSLRSPP